MIGKTISHYKIIEKLGEGGMGEVYLAEDTKLERKVALKFLPPELTDDPEAKARFVREARSASALDHQNICTIHEIDETDDGRIFIVMALVEGETLKERIGRGPLPLDEVLETGVQVAQGLEKAHGQGVVHRDIKPANVMLSEDGGVKIVDFGLARLAGQARITKPGTTAGTAAYMSPEQATGCEVDQRTDIWSLGVVLYEMLTGRLPFRGDYDAATVYLILNVDARPVSELCDDVSRELEAVVQKCLEREPGARYQTAAELLADLNREMRRKVSGEVTTAEMTAPRVRAGKPLLRLLAFPIALIFLVLLALFAAPEAWRALERWFAGAEIPAEKHLAVLPFTNIGGDQANQSFCDGLMETLCSNLSAMEQFQDSLWVVPAREVVDRGITSPGKARRAFGVSLVVTGSVELAGDSVRLNLNLIDTGSMRQLRSRVLRVSMAEMTSLQDETVTLLAEMLEVELQPRIRSVLMAGRTDTADAYHYYIQGRGVLQDYQVAENIDRAIALFEKALEADPRYALALAGLGEACFRKYAVSKDIRWAERAIESCDRAVESNDRLSPVRTTLGIVYNATGRYEDAVGEFNRALELDPVSAEAHRGLAESYRLLGKKEEAESTYLEAIGLRPAYWAGYHDLAVFYLRTGRYEDAVTRYLKVLELTPENTKAFNNLGFAYRNLGRNKDAREMFEHSMEIKANKVAVNNLGVLYFSEGRYADSARMFEQALEWADRSDYRVWGNLASAYNRVEEAREKALEFYRQAAQLAEGLRKINPLDSEVLADLAVYYKKLGERSSAIRMLEQLPEDVQDGEVMFSAAQTWERLGERENALLWIGRALESGFPQARIEGNTGLSDLCADERYQRLLQGGNVRQ